MSTEASEQPLCVHLVPAHGVASRGKESTCLQETQAWSLGAEDALEKEQPTLEKAAHSSVLAWETPWAWQALAHRATRAGCNLVTESPPPQFQVTNYQNICLRFVHFVYIFQKEFYEVKCVAPFSIGIELWTV